MKIIITALLTFASIALFAQWQGTNPVYFTTGNVGIGTATPTGKLDVRNTASGPAIKASSSNRGIIEVKNTSDVGWTFSNDSNGDFALTRNSSNDKLTVNSNGDIAVGTIPSSLTKLHVRSSGANSWSFVGQASSGPRFIGIHHDGINGIVASSAASNVDYSPLQLWTSNLPRMAIDVNGNIGIGTTVPAFKLDVNGAINATSILVNGQALSAGPSSQWTTNGTSIGYLTGNAGIGTTTPAVKLQVDISGTSTNYGAINSSDIGLLLKNSSATNNNFNILSFGDAGGYGVAHVGSTIKDHTNHVGNLFFATKSGSSGLLERMRIDENGNVGIGTTNPNQKLTVNGTIYGKEVKVDLSVPGPDYVFDKDYQLTSLEDIKSYIDQHKHLPEVPSAAAMEADGINLSEMNMILLKKVEELTLHIIEQNKRITALEQPNKQ